jgi:hypothetical protein
MEVESREFHNLKCEILNGGYYMLWIYDEGLGFCAVINGSMIDESLSRSYFHYSNQYDALNAAWKKYKERIKQ